MLVGMRHYLVWIVFGMVVFLLGSALAILAMQQPEIARAVPIGTGPVILIGGALQFTAWKAQHLACSRQPRCGGLLPAANIGRRGDTGCASASTAAAAPPG